MAAAHAGAPHPADGIDLINEYNGRGFLLGVVKHIPHPRGADPYEHCDKFRAADGEKRHLRFTGHRPGHKGLAGAGRADKKHAFGQLTAQGPILVRVLKKADDFLKLLFGVFKAGHIIELDIAHGFFKQFGFGKSKAKLFEKSMSDVEFDDVAGLENTKKELQEIIGFLKDPDKYRSLGGKLPKGVLLVGPPGTGKTLMARAVAGEAEVPFFSISGSEFIEMFVGVGASRVRDMFDNAKKESPAIIFIDEIDSIGRVRGTGVGGGHDEREQTLNQILNEMDGFSPQESVVVMAATNRPDVLDSALTRPGRFDHQVPLELPQKNARISILKVHTKHVTVGDDVALEVVANRTVGFSGAELQNLVNEAALLAARKGKEKVEAEDFDQARDKILMGIEREDLINEEEKEVIAYHESGHAMMSMLLPGADPLEKVTIIPRGRALGATEQIPEEDRFNLTRGYLLDRITVMLGGRAAEQVQFSDSTTGAGDDLQKATEIARRMVTQWGMSDKVGSVAFQYGSSHPFLGRELGSQKDFSEETAKIIDDEVRRLVSECLSKAIDVLNNHKQELDSLAQALLDRETLSKNEVKEIIGKSHAKTAPAEN